MLTRPETRFSKSLTVGPALRFDSNEPYNESVHSAGSQGDLTPKLGLEVVDFEATQIPEILASKMLPANLIITEP